MINLEMYASYTYTSMAYYFSVMAWLCLAHHFFRRQQGGAECATAISFQNKRGGHISSRTSAGEDCEPGPAGPAQISSDKVDPHLCDFLGPLPQWVEWKHQGKLVTITNLTQDGSTNGKDGSTCLTSTPWELEAKLHPHSRLQHPAVLFLL
ncbi:hypothetical protein DPEC_G00134140 [Dallia pectoralis]|uniref:Uncharacterized protein n=1 Tax=Dallia pectoralis TaxID=75939 RepID=A0ACC2GRQ9_DALPE|nr:hypothetical protein DPEC_G00134140 [Dallia pectoralis]